MTLPVSIYSDPTTKSEVQEEKIQKNTKLLKRRRLRHLRKDVAQKIISLDEPVKSIAVIGNRGSVGVLEPSSLKTISVYDVDMECKGRAATLTTTHNHVRNWVTDVVNMTGCDFYVVATTNRCLHFIDTSDYTHLEGYRVVGMPALVSSLHFSTNGDSHLLFFGDAKGNVGYFCFHQPLIGLFEGKRFAGVEVIAFKDLQTNHSKYVEYSTLSEGHHGPVRRVSYDPGSGLIISCSLSQQNSLIIQQIEENGGTKSINFCRGVSDFIFDPEHELLVTNSSRCELHSWKCCPHEKKISPRRILSGHQAPVSSMFLTVTHRFLLTLDNLLFLLIWSPTSQQCLRQMRLEMPSLADDRCQSIRPFLFSAFGNLYAAQGKYLVKLSRELSQGLSNSSELESSDVNNNVEVSVSPKSRGKSEVTRKGMLRKGWILSSREEKNEMIKECVRSDRPFTALKHYRLDNKGAMPRAEDHWITINTAKPEDLPNH